MRCKRRKNISCDAIYDNKDDNCFTQFVAFYFICILLYIAPVAADWEENRSTFTFWPYIRLAIWRRLKLNYATKCEESKIPENSISYSHAGLFVSLAGDLLFS